MFQFTISKKKKLLLFDMSSFRSCKFELKIVVELGSKWILGIFYDEQIMTFCFFRFFLVHLKMISTCCRWIYRGSKSTFHKNPFTLNLFLILQKKQNKHFETFEDFYIFSSVSKNDQHMFLMHMKVLKVFFHKDTFI